MKDLIIVKTYISPIGPLLLGSFGDRLCLCDWRTSDHAQRIDKRLQARLSAVYKEGRSEVIEAALLQLEEYFLGRRDSFSVPLLVSGTDFQLSVWRELSRIPYGATISYAELARRIGRPTAVRAVANANNANPLSLFVPCHRVIGSDRKLTGYGGGLAVKRQLLALEAEGNSIFDVSSHLY